MKKSKVKLDYPLKENEKWVKGYEGRYFVNTSSEVYSVIRANPVRMRGATITNRSRCDSTGYRILCLIAADGVTSTAYLHKIVAESFIPNPENKPQVNHKDLNKQNNRVENLEWVTASENIIHAMENGVRKYKKGVLDEDESLRKTVVDNLIVNGVPEAFGEKYPISSVIARVKDEDLLRNGVPPELLKKVPEKIINTWRIILIIFSLIDMDLPASKIARITGKGHSVLYKYKNGTGGKNLRALYEKYKNNPQCIDPHLSWISSHMRKYKDWINL